MVLVLPSDALYPGADTYPGVDATPSAGSGLALTTETPDALTLTVAP